MVRTMKQHIYTFIFVFFGTTSFSQTTEDINVKYMLRGYFYAGTDTEDRKAPGGFGSSSNTPKEINNHINGEKGKLSMYIDVSEASTFWEKYSGYKLYIVNQSGKRVKLGAQDSRIAIVAEVLVGNEWKPIEYLPSSWCGNSYHNVSINNNKYWEFNIPKYIGSTKTKLRYRLNVNAEQVIFSNEIRVSYNPEQLTEKRPYRPSGLMDPYDE